MTTDHVYLVWYTADGDDSHAQLVGLYTDERQAQHRIERARNLGLGEYPADFRITESPLDHYEWSVSA